jgi:hypothetical protein
MSKVNQTASRNKRFVLDSQTKIIDKLHPERGTEHFVYMNAFTIKPYDDELHLRSGLLFRRLERLVPELARGNGSKGKGKTLSHEICHLLPDIIQASQLNRRDVQISLQNPFRGKLKHRKTEMRELTSISLFIDDVERLLRDLYGDIDGDDLNDVINAIRSTVERLSTYVLPDLAEEYNMAIVVDMGAGRGLDPGDGVSSRMVRDSVEPAETLILRARKVLSSESDYGRYTVSSAKALKEYWPAVQGWRPLAKTVPEAIAKLQMRCKYVKEPA